MNPFIRYFGKGISLSTKDRTMDGRSWKVETTLQLNKEGGEEMNSAKYV